MFGGFVFLDGCSGLWLANLSDGWLILGLVVVPISLVVFLFLFLLFKVALVDVGLCWWWLVGVVVGGHYCDSGGCAVVVVDGDNRKVIRYYFNV